MHRDLRGWPTSDWKIAASDSAGGIAERSEKIIRLSGRLGAYVGVPRQFDADHPSISNFGQGRDYRRKIDFALAEHEVLVDAGPHVLDVDVDQPIGPLAEFVGDRQLALAVEVADVDREPELVGVGPPLAERSSRSAKRAIVSMNMPGSGSKARGTVFRSA